MRRKVLFGKSPLRMGMMWLLAIAIVTLLFGGVESPFRKRSASGAETTASTDSAASDSTDAAAEGVSDSTDAAAEGVSDSTDASEDGTSDSTDASEETASDSTDAAASGSADTAEQNDSSGTSENADGPGTASGTASGASETATSTAGTVSRTAGGVPIAYGTERFAKDTEAVKGLSFGMTRSEVLKACPSPNREVSHDGEDSFIYGPNIEFQYTGMTLQLYDVLGGENLTLGSVLLTGEDRALYNGLHPGSTAAEVYGAYYGDGKDRSAGSSPDSADPWGVLLYGDYLFTWENGYAVPEKEEQTAYVTLPYGDSPDWYITYGNYIPVEDGVEEITLTFHMEGDTVQDIRWSRDLV